MRKGNLLFSAVQFIFVVALFLLGGLCVGLQYAPHLRLSLVLFLTDHAAHLSFLGYGMISCAMLLTIGFYVMYQGSYFRIQMEKGEVLIEPKLIEKLVHNYWKERFPGKVLKTEVLLRGQEKIEIVAEMPSVEDRMILLHEVEKELGTLLEQHLKYHGEWKMTLIAK